VSGGTMWVTVNFAKVPRGQNSAPIRDAVRQSTSVFTGGRRASYVVIGRSDVFADNLAGAALAGAHAPLLLTSGPRREDRSPVLHPAARAEVDRLLGGRGVVYVLGGEQAVSATAAAELAAGGYTVRRLGGETRLDTSAAIAREALARRGNDDEILLARAEVWADAISAGGYAASSGAPLLLTDSRALAPQAASVIASQPDADVIALGGPVALSDRVVHDAGAARVAGPDRYATSVAVAEELWGARPDKVIAVHGKGGGWAYALTQVSRADLEDAPLLQVTTTVPSVVANYLRTTRANVSTATDVASGARNQLSSLSR
jgi:putative cell wall-binding protein